MKIWSFWASVVGGLGVAHLRVTSLSCFWFFFLPFVFFHRKMFLHFFSCISFKYVSLLASVWKFNCFLHSRCSMEMWCPSVGVATDRNASVTTTTTNTTTINVSGEPPLQQAMRFHPLWGVESCSLPSRWPNSIPAVPPDVVTTAHLHTGYGGNIHSQTLIQMVAMIYIWKKSSKKEQKKKHIGLGLRGAQNLSFFWPQLLHDFL